MSHGQTEAKRLTEEGEALHSQGRLDEAAQRYAEAIKKEPLLARPRYRLAGIFAYWNKDLDNARKLVEPAIQTAKDEIEKAKALFTLADIDARMGRFDDAIFGFRECLRLLGDDRRRHGPEVLVCLSKCHLAKGEKDQALMALRRAVAADPNNHEAHLMYADACRDRHLYHEAVTHYERADAALMADERIPFPVRLTMQCIILTNLGATWYWLGDVGRSEQAHLRAYQANPRSPYPSINLAQVAESRGDMSTMRHYLEQGIPLIHPQDRELVGLLERGALTSQHGDLVLGLLHAHGLIDPLTYQRSLGQYHQLKIKSEMKQVVFYKEETIMGDQYKVEGQAGAVGRNAKAKDMSFQQIRIEQLGEVDLNALAQELTQLRGKMRGAATEPEHDIAIGHIAAAEAAAKKGDSPGVVQHLKDAGKWMFDFARDAGVNLVAEVMKKSMGL